MFYDIFLAAIVILWHYSKSVLRKSQREHLKLLRFREIPEIFRKYLWDLKLSCCQPISYVFVCLLICAETQYFAGVSPYLFIAIFVDFYCLNCHVFVLNVFFLWNSKPCFVVRSFVGGQKALRQANKTAKLDWPYLFLCVGFLRQIK